jgi:hypothetical protein
MVLTVFYTVILRLQGAAVLTTASLDAAWQLYVMCRSRTVSGESQLQRQHYSIARSILAACVGAAAAVSTPAQQHAAALLAAAQREAHMQVVKARI